MSSNQLALLKKYSLPIRGFRGQHLLIDPNIQRKIVELVDPQTDEWILEIGPGLGALTGGMLARGVSVIAVEKDRRFCEILEVEWGAKYKGGLKIINRDILKTDAASLRGSIPDKAEAISKKGLRNVSRARQIASPASGGLAMTGEGSPRNDDRVKVVSNLPYYITSPVLFWLIENRRHIKQTVLMMQREVANRLLAQPGDKDYGRLTLAIRYYAEVRRAFHVSRNCFTPKPDVDSTVVTLDFYPPSKFPKRIDEDLLFHIIKVAFGARRKTLLNRLAHDSRIGKSRSKLVEILGRLGIPENARAENLLLKDFMALAASLFPLPSGERKKVVVALTMRK